MKKINITNQRFGNLTVLRQSANMNKKTAWECLCDCGNVVTVTTSNLTCNRIKSCGCMKKELLIKRNSTHNQRNTHLYEVWKSIKQRCKNPQSYAYKNYGGRGITICKEWNNDFKAFSDWSYANGYTTENRTSEKTKLTIDRINNDGNYEPSNCRWVTRSHQCKNKRNNKVILYHGKSLCLVDWCKELNLHYTTISGRISRGWSIEKSFETPTKKPFTGTH